MAITQKQIAEMLGVSQITVSLALRDSPEIGEATRKRVKEIARRFNYYPSSIARTLSTGRSRTIGIIISNLSEPFYVELLANIAQNLALREYSWIVLTTDGKTALEVMEEAMGKSVEGIISFNYHLREHLIQCGVPFLLNVIDEECDYVALDKYKGAEMMMEHLAGLGYRKIGYLCRTDISTPRFDAYKDILLKYGLLFRKEWIVPGWGYRENGYRAMQKLLALKERPEAVFAMNDLAAIGAMRAVKEEGLKIPEDIAVAGFDNIEESRYLQVSLTTVDQCNGEMARRFVEAVLEKIERNNHHKPCRVEIEPRLVIRESCGYSLRKGLNIFAK